MYNNINKNTMSSSAYAIHCLNLLIKVKYEDTYYYFIVNKKKWNEIEKKLETFNTMDEDYTYNDTYDDIYKFYKSCKTLEIDHKTTDIINFLFLSNWILKDIENHISEIEKKLLYESHIREEESDSSD